MKLLNAVGIALSMAFASGAAMAQSADMYASKTAPPTAAVGTNVTYSITVGNGGPDDATTASFTDNLPGGGTFVSYQQTSGVMFDCSLPNVGDAGGTVICSTATLAAGTTATFSIVQNVSAGAAGTTLINSMAVSSQVPDDNSENDTSITGTDVPGGNLADVGIVKTGPDSASPNTDVTYSITVTNSGPSDALSVSFKDTLPSGVPASAALTFVSFSQTSGPTFNCGSPGATTTCTIATMPANTTATFSLVAHVPPGTPAGTTFSNEIAVTSQDDPNSENDTSSATVTISTADAGVMKSAPATAVAGGPTFDYIITLSDGGPDPATDVSFSDNLPSGLTFVSLVQNSGPAATCATPAVNSGGNVACTISLLPVGSAQFTLTVQPLATIPNGTVLTNTVTETSSSADPNSTNNSASAMTTVSSSADLKINKSGPASANAGTNITYTVTVTNSGPSAAASVSLTDAVPANTTFVSESQTAGPAFSCTTPAAGGTGTINCSIASFANNSSATFLITVHIAPGATGTVTNTANVTSATSDPSSAGNNPTATTTITRSADIGIVKTAAASATAGSNLTYSIAVTNNGPSDSATVTMADTLPPNTTFVSETQNSGPAFVCVNPAVGATGAVSCSIATLTAGTTATFSVVVKISPTAPSGPSSNTATVVSANDPNSANDTSTATTTVSSSADLAVTKTGPATATAGTDITYTVTLTNNGPSTATTVSLTDAVPPNTTFVSESQTAGPALSCTTPAVGGSGTITCTAASFATSVPATFSITVHIVPGAAGTTITNTASATAATADPASANNAAPATTTVTRSADISVLKTAAATATAGTNLTYTITVTNNGPSDAATVTMADTLPPNTTFVSESQTSGPAFVCTNPPAGGAGAVSCSIAALTLGTSATFSIVVQVAPLAPAGPSSNTATITSANDPNAGNNTATATTNITLASADLSITKTPSAGPYGTGGLLTYTIVVSNGGPFPANSVVVTDVLPAGTTYVSSTPAGACSGTTTITCNAGTLANGASATFGLTVTLPSAAGPVTNTATASAAASSPDPNLGNNTATSTITVIPAANIPMVSPLALLLLCFVLAVAGAFVQKQ
jgi:uncharacterized repeat protein (TIGR01451 family)